MTCTLSPTPSSLSFLRWVDLLRVRQTIKVLNMSWSCSLRLDKELINQCRISYGSTAEVAGKEDRKSMQENDRLRCIQIFGERSLESVRPCLNSLGGSLDLTLNLTRIGEAGEEEGRGPLARTWTLPFPKSQDTRTSRVRLFLGRSFGLAECVGEHSGGR